MSNIRAEMFAVRNFGAVSNIDSNLTAAGHYGAGLFIPVAGKTITHIVCYCKVATGSPVIDAQLETVSSYTPTGTLIATGAALTGQSVAIDTAYEFALATPYVVPTGATTMLAAVLRYVSGTAVNFEYRNNGENTANPRCVHNVGAGAVQTVNLPLIGIKYSDGSYHGGIPVGASGLIATSINSGTTPDEVGNRFTSQITTYCVGIKVNVRFNPAGGSMRLRIYSATDSDTPNAVLTTDSELTASDISSATATQGYVYLPIANPVLLVKGNTYFFTIASMNGTNILYQNITWRSEAMKGACVDDLTFVSRSNDTGDFTVDTLKHVSITPIISVGSSSGGRNRAALVNRGGL